MTKFLKSSLQHINNNSLKAIGLFFLVLLFLSSCSLFHNKKKSGEDKGKVIAEVRGNYLYESDLSKIFTSAISKEDSIALVKEIINKWILEQLIYKKALANLTNEEKDKQELLDNYYQQLITFEYEKKIVNQQLKKNVTEDELKTYYDNNRDLFILKKCLLKVVFLRVNSAAPDLDQVRKWYISNKQTDQDLLLQYAMGNASSFSFDDKKWFYIDELRAQIPITSTDCSGLYEGMAFEIADSSSNYFVKVNEIKAVGTYSPYEFIKDKIKEVILHQRSLSLMKNIHEQIYTEGIKKNYFKIYE